MLRRQRNGSGGVFLVYVTPLTAVTLFKYLGRKLLSSDEYWLEVEQILRRVRGKWGRLAKILGREGAERRTVGGGGVMWRWCKRSFYLVPRRG